MSSDDRAYRVVVRFEKEKDRFVAMVPELDLTATGATRAEAIQQVEEGLESRLQAAAAGEALPAPTDVLAPPEALSIKLSAAAYRDLAFAASQDRISIEALATELIARGLGFREGARGGARRPAPQGQMRGAPVDPAADPDAQPAQDPAQRPQEPRDRDRGPPRDRRREGYRPEHDNQANFLEYLRGLEKGGGQGGGNQGGGGGGGGGRNRGRR